MPTLNWIGKQAVVKHHRAVPFRLLEPIAELSHPSPASGGELWAARSNGRCKFVWVEAEQWHLIAAAGVSVAV